MTRKELNQKTKNCPACKEKPALTLISKLKPDWGENNCFNNSNYYYRLECACGMKTNDYVHKDDVILAWNNEEFLEINNETNKKKSA